MPLLNADLARGQSQGRISMRLVRYGEVRGTWIDDPQQPGSAGLACANAVHDRSGPTIVQPSPEHGPANFAGRIQLLAHGYLSSSVGATITLASAPRSAKLRLSRAAEARAASNFALIVSTPRSMVR
jgi:hypothetical protein